MRNPHLTELTSIDPSRRFTAVMSLRHVYDEEVGHALVTQLIKEDADGVWWAISRCALPVWLPLFDRTLLTLPAWPFTGCRTLRILDLCKGHVLHSAGNYIEPWLASPDWSYRFAAFRWLVAGGSTMERAQRASVVLLNELRASFEVDLECLRRCSWMREFYVMESRIREIEAFLEECS